MHFSPSLVPSSQASVGMAPDSRTNRFMSAIKRKGAFARLHVADAAFLHRLGANQVLELRAGGRGVAEFLSPKCGAGGGVGKHLGGFAFEGFAEVALGGIALGR